MMANKENHLTLRIRTNMVSWCFHSESANSIGLRYSNETRSLDIGRL